MELSYCGEHSIVNDQGTTRTVATLRCRSWTCPHCHDDRRRRLIANAFGGKPNTFLTLTSRRVPDADADAAALALSNAWRILRKRALREAERNPSKHALPFGAAPADGWFREGSSVHENKVRLYKGRFPFLAVIEKTEAGWPHLHILARTKWVDHEWLSAQMAQLLDSPMVWIERLNSRKKAAAYAVKYCGKATHKFDTAKRYWQSADYDTWRRDHHEDGEVEKAIWERRRARMWWIVQGWIGRGWRVTIEGTDRATAEVPAGSRR